MTDGRPYNVHVYGNYCFNKPAPGENSPHPPPPNPPKKMIHLLLPDTINVRTLSFFLKRHLFNVPYISRHVPYRVFLPSVNVRTPKTCPLFLIKLLFFTSGILCIRASVSGRMDVIYVRILLPYAEKFDPGRMTYVQLL